MASDTQGKLQGPQGVHGVGAAAVGEFWSFFTDVIYQSLLD